MMLNQSEPLEAVEVARKNQMGKTRGMVAEAAACMQDHHKIGGGRIRQSWQLRAIFSALLLGSSTPMQPQRLGLAYI
jgi:cellobiose-specific phosphotransferase system component IIA